MKIEFNVYFTDPGDGSTHIVVDAPPLPLGQAPRGQDLPARLIPYPDGTWKLEIMIPAPSGNADTQ